MDLSTVYQSIFTYESTRYVVICCTVNLWPGMTDVMTCQTVNKRFALPHGFSKSSLQVFTTVTPFRIKGVYFKNQGPPIKPTRIWFIDIFGWLGPSGSPWRKRNKTTAKRILIATL